MGLDERAIPNCGSCAGWEWCAGWRTGPEEGGIGAVCRRYLTVQLAQIEQAGAALSAEALVPDPAARDLCPSLGQKTCWHLSNHGIEADALGPKFAHIEGLTPRKEPAVGIAVEQVDVAITGAEQGGG